VIVKDRQYIKTDTSSSKSKTSRAVEGAPARPFWASQRTYVLASIAGVVGLGNIWRFPYMVGQNGGGTFVLAYAICILAIGIPLYVLEASAGNFADRGPIGLFRRINSKWGAWVGWFLVVILLAIMSYYLVVSGWTLGYAVDAIRGELKPFQNFTSGFASLWYLLAIGGLSFLILLRGIKGLESTSKFLLPLLVVIVGGLAIYVQTLPGAKDAAEFYFSFNLDKFLELETWRMAASQAFYSLAIGQGMIITYGSYIPRNINIVTSSSAVAGTNALISITAGLMVFPIVFTFGIATDVGSALSFSAFPLAFRELSGGLFIGIAFYTLLFVAAFTSCVGGLTVLLAAVRDELGLSRCRAALMVTCITVGLGVPSALSFTSLGLNIGGKPFLDVIDQITGSGVVLVAGIVGAALISWRLPKLQLFEAMNNPPIHIGPITLSTQWMISVGRYLPAAIVILAVVTYLL